MECTIDAIEGNFKIIALLKKNSLFIFKYEKSCFQQVDYFATKAPKQLTYN